MVITLKLICSCWNELLSNGREKNRSDLMLFGLSVEPSDDLDYDVCERTIPAWSASTGTRREKWM